ncbi:unnamed protein product [Oikopleura dioica]|uniref:Claudin n=1 Tax=Oikopleura dioica TaxID=34765 RepID=E4X1Y2_OIKDI|nr:unnamed protein product [Oikopleura dioica]
MSQFEIDISPKKLNVLAYGIVPALLTTSLQAASLTSNYWFEQVIVSTNSSSIPFAQEIHFGLFRHCTRRIPLGGSDREGSICQNLENVDIGRVDQKLPEDVQTLKITMIVHFIFSALLVAALMGLSIETVCFSLTKKRRRIIAFSLCLGTLFSLISMLAYVTWSRSRSTPSALIGGTVIQPGIGFVLSWISSGAHFCTLLTLCLTFYLN